MARGDPIEGQVLLLATAKAGVGPRLPDLIDDAQAHLGPRLDDLRRRYETVFESDEFVILLADDGFWERVGERLGFSAVETSAVRRAHDEQLLWTGRRENRRAEFESALEIRDAVVVGRE